MRAVEGGSREADFAALVAVATGAVVSERLNKIDLIVDGEEFEFVFGNEETTRDRLLFIEKHGINAYRDDEIHYAIYLTYIVGMSAILLCSSL